MYLILWTKLQNLKTYPSKLVNVISVFCQREKTQNLQGSKYISSVISVSGAYFGLTITIVRSGSILAHVYLM